MKLPESSEKHDETDDVAMTFSRGPWRVIPFEGRLWIGNTNSDFVAEIFTEERSGRENLSNANLMASSPALFEALSRVCEAWTKQIGRVFESMGTDNPRAKSIDEAIESAKSVLKNLQTLNQ